jgi:hypothetical protein
MGSVLSVDTLTGLSIWVSPHGQVCHQFGRFTTSLAASPGSFGPNRSHLPLSSPGRP